MSEDGRERQLFLLPRLLQEELGCLRILFPLGLRADRSRVVEPTQDPTQNGARQDTKWYHPQNHPSKGCL